MGVTEAQAGLPLPMRLAELSARLPSHRGCPVDILLAAAQPFDDAFIPLRPLWRQEALHRAAAMLRLFAALHSDRQPSLRSIYERRLALHLAAELAALDVASTSAMLPCSGPLREVTRDLVALFGPATGQVELATEVMPLSLSPYRRRALVLLGYELVTNALTHAFDGRSHGRVSVRLELAGPGQARLHVGDDGIGFAHGRPVPALSLAGALADVLAGEMRYHDRPDRGSIAEIVFPTRA